MALSDREGNTHSHLNNQDRGDSYSKHLSQQPDRGTWVGPRPGTTHEQHAANAAKEWGDRIDRENRERMDHANRKAAADHGLPTSPFDGELPEGHKVTIRTRVPEQFWRRSGDTLELQLTSGLSLRRVYRTETLEKRVDQLEKAIIKLQSAVIELQSRMLDR